MRKRDESPLVIQWRKDLDGLAKEVKYVQSFNAVIEITLKELFDKIESEYDDGSPCCAWDVEGWTEYCKFHELRRRILGDEIKV